MSPIQISPGRKGDGPKDIRVLTEPETRISGDPLDCGQAPRGTCFLLKRSLQEKSIGEDLH